MTDIERLLLVPGGGGSDPGHWHHEWAAVDDRCEWVHQADPSGGTRDDWVSTIDRRVQDSAAPTVLVAHSLATIAVNHWAAGATGSVVGALLVGPTDLEADWLPAGSLYERFLPMPMAALPFPSTIVASSDDPYLSLGRAEQLSAAWGSQLEVVGACGHIGADADLGMWPAGRRLLDELIGRLPASAG